MDWWFWPVAIIAAPLAIAAWGDLFLSGLVGIAYVRLRVRERRRAELRTRARRLMREAEVPAYLERRRQRCEVPEAFRRAWGE